MSEVRDGKSRVRRFHHPGPLDRAALELRKADDGTKPSALWHLTRALAIVVEYLMVKERG